MQLFDVYNDDGFVMRSTLPMIAIVFDLHPLAIDRIRDDAKNGKQSDVSINRSRKFCGVFTIFAATNKLEAKSAPIFPGRADDK